MRVRGGCTTLWHRQGVSQIGTSSGRRIIVNDLNLAEQHLLDEFAHSLENTGVYWATRHNRVSVARAREIVVDLECQGVLAVSATSEFGEADGVYQDQFGADAKGRNAVLFQAVLAVHGVSVLAQEAVLWLAEVGVDAILSVWPPQGGGLAPLLSARLPALWMQAPLHTRPNAVVTVDAHVVESLLAYRLVQEDVAHLPVVVGGAGVRIGPALGEGDPYSTCLDLWERDVDPRWPVLATQVRTLPMPKIEHLVLHEVAVPTAWAVVGTLMAQVIRADCAGDKTKPDGVTSGGSTT